MSTITAILEPDADGTLHLPLPEDLRNGRVKVVAMLQAEEPPSQSAVSKKETPLDSLKELRKLGGLGHVFSDPIAWQREQRKERPLPGRE